MTLKENIFLGDVFNQSEYDFYKKELELETLEGKLLGSNGENISGGEKQRVVLARFFHDLAQKDFFIIDEGFIAVDKALKEKMLELTKDRIKGKSGICISHDDKSLKHLSP